jgi:hypothetical protein
MVCGRLDASMVSEALMSRVIVLPAKVFTQSARRRQAQQQK